MKKIWLYWGVGTIILLVIMLASSFYYKDHSVIKYFPLDTNSNFASYASNLEFAEQEDEDEYEVLWDMSSTSNQPMYLRQDVSLLYVNGRLKGVMNKWQENTKKILKKSSIHGEDTKRYQTVSFHHGEIHQGDEPITSIQAVSNDTLYVIDSPHSNRTAFHKPSTPEEEQWQKKLDHSINQQITVQWEELLAYYQIPKDQYEMIPLTQLGNYNNQPFPGTTQDNYQRIHGQLWEGLYKNYILGITDKKSSSHPIQSYTPLILFDKNGTHLLVLFEDDTGKKHKLIQKY